MKICSVLCALLLCSGLMAEDEAPIEVVTDAQPEDTVVVDDTVLPPPAHQRATVASAPATPATSDAATTDDELLSTPPTIASARSYAAAGRRGDAIAVLEQMLFVDPDHKEAARLLRQYRIEESKEEIRALLAQEATDKNYVLGDPDYEIAKAASPVHITRKLQLVEYLITEQRFTEAVESCNRILDEHATDEATLILLDRLMSHLVRLERKRLEDERRVRNGEVSNEIIEASIMEREPAPLPREVLIFDEDIAAMEQAAVKRKLQIIIPNMIYDGVEVGDILRDVFTFAGLNFIILDSAIVSETLTIELVDETVEHILEIVQRSTSIAFNYRGGSVYVTSADNPIMVTEIIRLKSGLTNVNFKASGGGSTGGGTDDSGGGGGGPGIPDIFAPSDGGGSGGAGGGSGDTDLERFLAEVPNLVTWPEGSTIFLDRKSNSLYVRSSPSAILEVKRLLHGLDYNNVQVLIEARFAEITESALDEIGVQWGLVGQETRNGSALVYGMARGNPVLPDASNVDGTVQQLAGGLGNPAGGFSLGAAGIGTDFSPNFSVDLRALEQRGDANLLSEPKILTLNNATGEISFTTDIAYISNFENRTVNGTSQDVTIDNGTTVSSQQNVLVPQFETEQEEISLTVRPSVARNSDIISLELNPRIRALLGFASSGQFTVAGGTSVLGSSPVQQPQFAERQLTTTLHVKNGQTVVLGGLVSELDDRGRSGIPGLSAVPGFGLLFGQRSRTVNRSKLLIFVTAHIIDPSGSKYTEEIRHLRDRALVAMPAHMRDQVIEQQRLDSEQAELEAAERQRRLSSPNTRNERRSFTNRR